MSSSDLWSQRERSFRLISRFLWMQKTACFIDRMISTDFPLITKTGSRYLIQQSSRNDMNIEWETMRKNEIFFLITCFGFYSFHPREEKSKMCVYSFCNKTRTLNDFTPGYPTLCHQKCCCLLRSADTRNPALWFFALHADTHRKILCALAATTKRLGNWENVTVLIRIFRAFFELVLYLEK